MIRRNSKNYRTLGFQRLEDRTLMAGNVTVAVQNAALVVTGDNSNNAIVITQSGSGKYTVAPGDSNTTINGKLAAQTFSGVTGDFNINLKAGADSMQIGNAAAFGKTASLTNIPGNLNINLTTSKAVVDLVWAKVGKAAAITGGTGSFVQFYGAQIGTDCNISLGGLGGYGGYSDILRMENNTTVGRDLNITINQTDTGLGAAVNLLDGFVGRNVTITGGHGDDTVAVANFTIDGALKIQTGAGADHVALGESFDAVGNLQHQTGTYATSISVDLGAGDDQLRLYNVSTHQASYLGGDGYDYLYNDGTSALFGSISGFELLPHVVTSKTALTQPTTFALKA